jgi:ophiobolin F synthase
MDLSTAIAAHEELSNAMDISKANINDGNVKSMKLKRLLSQCLLECISHDRQLGLRMLESYRKKWLDVMEHPDFEKVQTMGEYLTFRNLNGGME